MNIKKAQEYLNQMYIDCEEEGLLEEQMNVKGFIRNMQIILKKLEEK